MMTDNNELEFFNKKTKGSDFNLKNIPTDSPIHPKTVIAYCAPAALGLIFLWALLSATSHNGRYESVKAVHPYLPQQSIIVTPPSNVYNQAVGFDDQVSRIKGLSNSTKEYRSLGNSDNIDPKDINKIQALQQKLNKGSLSDKDIANSVDILNKIQKDYHNKEVK